MGIAKLTGQLACLGLAIGFKVEVLWLWGLQVLVLRACFRNAQIGILGFPYQKLL